MVESHAAFAMLVSCALKMGYLCRAFAQQDMFATSREQRQLSNRALRDFSAQLAQQQLKRFAVMTVIRELA